MNELGRELLRCMVFPPQVALANKNARTAWVILGKHTDFQMDHLPKTA